MKSKQYFSSILSDDERKNDYQYLLTHEGNHLDLYESFLDKAKKVVVKNVLIHNKTVCSGVAPSELQPLFDEIDLEQPLIDINDVLSELEEVYLDHAVYFHNSKYVAHLNCPIVIPGVLAELILGSINSSLDTYDQSLGGTLIEQKVIDWTNQRVGFSEQSDGVFTSGGTQSNLMGLLLARDHFCWNRLQHNVYEKGLPAEAHKFRIFTSEKSHFSIQKNAALLGLGKNAVISIGVDARYKMDVDELEREVKSCLSNGLIPIAVVATCGTTDFGSIDPIEQIASLTHDYGLWLHADAAYGCGLLISNENRALLNGIELVDSVTVDYHKSFFQPVSSGAFLVKNRDHLNYVTYHADYLNPKSQSDEGIPNLVNKSIQTTRRFDALKVWITLRTMGAELLGSYFDEPIRLAKNVAKQLDIDKHFELLHQPEISALVFRYLPEGNLLDDEIDRINVNIRKALFKSGKAIIAGTKVDNKQYLKFTLLNPKTTIKDIIEITSLIKYYGKQENNFC